MNPSAANSGNRRTTERAFFIAFALLTVVALTPIWLTSYPPLPDDAVHLAAASIWAHLAQPEYHLAEYYALKLGVTPYWGYYLLIRIFAVAVPVMTANRIVLSLYVLLATVGSIRLLDRFGHSRWSALGSFAFVWTFSFNFGFIHCALSFALVPWALAALDAFYDTPTLRRALVAVALGVGTYFNHVLGWGLVLGAGGLLGLMHQGRTARRMSLRAAVWLVIAGSGVAASLLGQGKGMGREMSHAAFSGRNPFFESCRTIADYVWNLCAGKEAQWAGAVVALCTVVLIITAKWQRSLHQWRCIAPALTAFGAYFLLPRSVLQPAYIWGVSFRFGAIALASLLLCVPGTIGGLRRWLLIPVAAASLFIEVDAWRHWREADRFVAGFDEVLAIPPTGSTVLFIVKEPWRDRTAAINYVNPYSWYQALRGGFNPWNFDDGFPIRYLKKLPAPSWREPVFDWATEGSAYDYVVGFNAPNAVPQRPPRVAERVLAKGRWTVWKLPSK